MKRFVVAISVGALVLSIAVHAQTSVPQAGPEYKILDAWAGDWIIQGEVKEGPSGPAYKVDWSLNGQRILGGFFLQIYHMWKAQGVVQNGLEVTGYDPGKKTCFTHGHNDDGSWMISTATFINERTCIETGSSYFPDGRFQRYRNTWNFSPDWKSLSVKVENEKDGTWWTSVEGKGVRPRSRGETETVEQELIRLEKEWADAWVKSDVAFFERIMSDDYMWTASEGYVCTKADNIALAKSGEDVITSWVLADIKVRVYRDAAVVTGCQTIKEMYKGEDVSGQERWTHTWVRRSGRWQCVAAHSSLIAQK
jgi:hypothetical protein